MNGFFLSIYAIILLLVSLCKTFSFALKTKTDKKTRSLLINFLDALCNGEYKRLTEKRDTFNDDGRQLSPRLHTTFPLPQHYAISSFPLPNDHQCDSRVLCNKESQTPSGPEGSSGRESLYVPQECPAILFSTAINPYYLCQSRS
jgi:hypothetical protein